MIHHRKFTVETDSSGDGVATEDVFGEIIAIHTIGADTSGADVVWDVPANADRGTIAETVLTLTDLGSGDDVSYPRRVMNDDTGGDLDDAGDLTVGRFLATGSMSMTVSDGGDTKTYTGSVWFDDGR